MFTDDLLVLPVAVFIPNHAIDHARAPVKLSACLESRLPVQRAQHHPRGLWVHKKLLNLRGEVLFPKKLVPDATFSAVSPSPRCSALELLSAPLQRAFLE